MFYSHEILSNSQYGVATIWLVATVGKGGQRKLTKKAIQEVNVPKACEKILDPGAPLALRLQGSLLYGVSRVFAQQCGYVLTDAEKTQSDMMTFFRVMQTSETDPQAGKTKRQNIILQDDPSFDLMNMLPNLDLLNWDKELLLLPSQGSASKFSQMTPLGGSQRSILSGRNSALNINLELPPSSHSAASCRIPSDFGRHSPLFGKSIHDPDNMPEFQPFGDDEIVPMLGVGLDFDAEGNLLEIIDREPELPPLPRQEELRKKHQTELPEAQAIQAGEIEEQMAPLIEDGNMLEFGEAALPDAVAFPTHKSVKKPTLSDTQTSETTETEQASAKMTRTRRTKHQTMLDETLRISREEFRDWSENYINNMDASRKRYKATTVTQAKKNALALLYGNGIADIGVHRGADFVHPLAADFSGNPLKSRLLGQEPDEVEPEAKKRRRRRKSDEAFEGEDNLEQGKRHSRQRVDDEAELGRGEDYDEDGHIMFDDHSIPEIGMDAAPPMEDRHSSSMMPWSRPGSVVPGSSVRGSAQKARPAPSPLFGPGSVVGSVNRYSDPAEPLFGRDDVGSQGSDFNFGGPVGAPDFGQASNTQTSTQGLDLASQDFLGYVTEQAEKRGIRRARDPENRRWIEFEELADPNTHTKAVAAQAFLHVLSLATKNTISVKQDGAAKMEPFGTIRIGVDVSDGNGNSQQAESEDELA